MEISNLNIKQQLPLKNIALNPLEKDDHDIICCICKGLLVGPVSCINCHNLFCHECITEYITMNSKCPQCSFSKFEDIPENIKSKCEQVKVFCPTCQEIVSLLNYSKHTQDHYKKCFNCGHICTESEDANKIKVRFLSHLKSKNDSLIESYKMENITDENILKKLFFLLYVETKRYNGYISVHNGWLKFTKYRPNAAFFTFSFENKEKFLQVYDHKTKRWRFIGIHYLNGVGIYDSGYGAIEYNAQYKQMISDHGITSKCPLTLRLSDEYFFFCKPNDLYEECTVECIFIDDYEPSINTY